MVNSMDASLNSYKGAWSDLPWPPSENNESSRAIRGPRWELKAVRAIAALHLKEGRRIVPITDECGKNMQALTFTSDDVARLVLQLKDSDYDKTMWCKATANPGVKIREEKLWHPCDAYKIVRRERIASNEWEGEVAYYIKLCLNPANTVLLLLSMHLQA